MPDPCHSNACHSNSQTCHSNSHNPFEPTPTPTNSVKTTVHGDFTTIIGLNYGKSYLYNTPHRSGYIAIRFKEPLYYKEKGSGIIISAKATAAGVIAQWDSNKILCQSLDMPARGKQRSGGGYPCTLIVWYRPDRTFWKVADGNGMFGTWGNVPNPPKDKDNKIDIKMFEDAYTVGNVDFYYCFSDKMNVLDHDLPDMPFWADCGPWQVDYELGNKKLYKTITFETVPPTYMNGTVNAAGNYSGDLLVYNDKRDVLKNLWSKPFLINFDYKYISGGDSRWNNIFAFGYHAGYDPDSAAHSNDRDLDDFTWAISHHGSTGTEGADCIAAGHTQGFYRAPNDSQFHNYKIVYDGKHLTVYTDNVMTHVREAEPLKKYFSFYFSGAGNKNRMKSEIKDFYVARYEPEKAAPAPPRPDLTGAITAQNMVNFINDQIPEFFKNKIMYWRGNPPAHWPASWSVKLSSTNMPPFMTVPANMINSSICYSDMITAIDQMFKIWSMIRDIKYIHVAADEQAFRKGTSKQVTHYDGTGKAFLTEMSYSISDRDKGYELTDKNAQKALVKKLLEKLRNDINTAKEVEYKYSDPCHRNCHGNCHGDCHGSHSNSCHGSHSNSCHGSHSNSCHTPPPPPPDKTENLWGGIKVTHGDGSSNFYVNIPFGGPRYTNNGRSYLQIG